MAEKNKNIEPELNFTGSYLKKKSVLCVVCVLAFSNMTCTTVRETD